MRVPWFCRLPKSARAWQEQRTTSQEDRLLDTSRAADGGVTSEQRIIGHVADVGPLHEGPEVGLNGGSRGHPKNTAAVGVRPRGWVGVGIRSDEIIDDARTSFKRKLGEGSGKRMPIEGKTKDLVRNQFNGLSVDERTTLRRCA